MHTLMINKETLWQWLCFAMLLVIISNMLSGCASGHGWQFGVGVWPVNAVNQQQVLKPEARPIKYNKPIEGEAY